MGEDILPAGFESLHEYFVNPASLDENSGEYESGTQSGQEEEELTRGGAQRNVEEQPGAHLTERGSNEYEEDVVAS